MQEKTKGIKGATLDLRLLKSPPNLALSLNSLNITTVSTLRELG